MALEYCVYGLQVLSDAPIPGLIPGNGAGCPKVRVRFNQRPGWWGERSTALGRVWYQSVHYNERGEPSLTIWQYEGGPWYRLVYAGGSDFLVNPQAGEIWWMWPAAVPVEDSATYLVGPVLGFVLRMRGTCCLHASAISIDNRVIAFAGPPHSGKSTVAAAFARLGYTVVTDDIVALIEEDGRFLVRPGYPRLCLWPDIAVALYGSSVELPRIIPNADDWDKRYLDLDAANLPYPRDTLPLSAIYLLEERTEAADCPRVETVEARPAVVQLAANTFMNYLPDRESQAREFRFWTRVVSSLPVRRVIPHANPAGLPELCKRILEDHRGLCNPNHRP